jgi:NADPH2:quinone reductase
VLIKNYAVVGVHWGMYNLMQPKFVHETHEELMRLHAAGRIAPLISRELPMTEVPSALASLATRGTWGKLVAHW